MDRFWENKNYIVQVIFSTICLGIALYMIITLPSTDDKIKWATGIVGFVLGYWLK
jgi:hypothetical protein